MNGMNLYNVLRAMPFKLTDNVGNVDSIGNAVFLAGEERYASPHPTFMFHGIFFGTEGASSIDEKRAKEMLDGILADQKRIGPSLENEARFSPSRSRACFSKRRQGRGICRLRRIS